MWVDDGRARFTESESKSKCWIVRNSLHTLQVTFSPNLEARVEYILYT